VPAADETYQDDRHVLGLEFRFLAAQLHDVGSSWDSAKVPKEDQQDGAMGGEDGRK
jgi:hypothetical protein